MTALFIALFAAVRSSVRSRLELETAILALRHQLAVLPYWCEKATEGGESPGHAGLWSAQMMRYIFG